jgi:polysaccharide export outer membrane protein
MWRIFGLLLSLCLATGCTGSGGDAPLNPVQIDYTIASGDKIKLIVDGEKDFSGVFVVDSQGNITAPILGAVKVGGMSLSQAAASYGAKLRDGQILRDPKVSAEAVGLRPILVLGEVKRPGQFAYVNGMTIRSAVELAEGYTYYARESMAEITRAGRTVEVDVDVGVKIMPGDTVRIPRRLF